MFARELVEHTGGYHQTYGQVDRADALKWFAQRSLRCPRTYLDFLSEIGPGNYFSGGLVLFEVELGGLVDQVTEKLGCDGSDYLAIGYDGTTDGYYCMKNSETDEAVYWYDSETKAIGPHHRSFVEWVEECPRTLFSHSVYAGYKRIKDLAQVRRVIRERMSFDVRLLRYDRQTVRPRKKKRTSCPGTTESFAWCARTTTPPWVNSPSKSVEQEVRSAPITFSTSRLISRISWPGKKKRLRFLSLTHSTFRSKTS
jgi:hypothetical protein